MKRSALVGVKVAISLALLAYLFSITDLRALEERVRTADLLDLLGAVLCFVLMLALATWRWRILLSALGAPAPLGHLTASYLVATFFNNFLPSNIGGDIVRVRDSSKLTGSTATSLAVVGIDRILGFGALYLLAAVAWLLAPPAVRGLAGARVVLLGLAALFGFLAYVFFRPGTARWLMSVSRLSSIDWAQEQFEVVQGAVHAYRSRLRTIWMAGLASLLLQTLVVLYYLAIARSLGIPLAGRRGLPDGAAVLAAAGGADLVQRLGPARGALHRVLRPGRPSPGERPRLLARGRRPHGAAVALGRDHLDGAGSGHPGGAQPPPEAHGRPRPARLRQVRRPRVEHPRGLAPVLLVVPALRPRALRGVAVRPQAPGARHALARGAGHPRPAPRPRPLRPAHPGRPRRPGPGARRAHPARPRLRRRRLRPPRRARGRGEAGAPRALRRPADARLPGARRPPPAPPDRRRDRGEPLDARVPGPRALRARRARPPHLERRPARRVRPRAPRARPARPARARVPRRRPRRRVDRPSQRPEGTPLPRRGGRAAAAAPAARPGC